MTHIDTGFGVQLEFHIIVDGSEIHSNQLISISISNYKYMLSHYLQGLAASDLRLEWPQMVNGNLQGFYTSKRWWLNLAGCLKHFRC